MWSGGTGVRSRASRHLRTLGVHAPLIRESSSSLGSVVSVQKGVFGVPIENVPQVNIECCGNILRIPSIVYDACDMLKSHMHTEGLFRKAGSQSRQKEIRHILNSGGKIDKTNHAIDISSLLKQYLRSLPVPIINHDTQELLLRCFMLSDKMRLCAIQLALLFLPLSHLYLLHYMMEFLRCVSLQCAINKMDTNNLAIILAPTIMPPPLDCPPTRLNHHVKLVKFLIDNANKIGIVPDEIESFSSDEIEKEEVQKKKKRRSGSLTRMFTGLRKIVSSSSNKVTSTETLMTPILNKGGKKRSQLETHGLSAKKRKEILENIPLTPLKPHLNKEQKKLILNQNSKLKTDVKSDLLLSCDNAVLETNVLPKSFSEFKIDNKDNEYVRIPKSEYEEIKNRVSAIENRLSKEFSNINVIDNNCVEGEPVKQVQTVYEKTLEEAAMLSSLGSDNLARRLSKELNIRQSGEHKIIRSPSARKIGVIRRRSRENVTKLTRTQTWTTHNQNDIPVKINDKNNQFYNTTNLKRGRPNTVNTGLIHPSAYFIFDKDKIESGNIENLKYDASLENNISTLPTYNTRSCSRRPSSFHGLTDITNPIQIINKKSNKTINRSDNEEWKNARIIMTDVDDFNNPVTGRASVAKLRSQMAGMVLAKARLFDGLTDSDSSLEKIVNKKPSKQISTFARKSRRHISPEKSTTYNSSNDLTPPNLDLKIFKKYKSPAYIPKRNRAKSVKSPVTGKNREQLNLSTQLKDVIYDVCTPLSDKIVNENNVKMKESLKSNITVKSSPRVTPHIKKSLSNKAVNNFKSVHNVSNETRKFNTPLKVNHNTPRRQSPRLVSIKNRHLI